LVYDEYGKGAKVVVLLPGLLFSRRMHQPLAEELAERGYRVLCLDLLGHGESDRPPEMWNYGMSVFGRQTIALLDHAGIDKAVIGGTSLGANVTLEAAAAGPDRVKGMLIEMPVLDNALLGCAIAFTPLLVGLTFGAPVARAIGAAAVLGLATILGVLLTTEVAPLARHGLALSGGVTLYVAASNLVPEFQAKRGWITAAAFFGGAVAFFVTERLLAQWMR